MRILLFFIALAITSCTGKNYRKEYYDNGKLKTDIEVNDAGIPNGLYKEYYDSGELKMKTKHILGENIDTTYIYTKQSSLKEKGVLKNNKKKGWWFYYDSLGILKKQNEYIPLNGGVYKNQSKIYNKDGTINNLLSSYYKIDIPDTLKLGKNTGEIHYNSNLSSNEKSVFILIENEYSDTEKKIDTFIEEPNYSRFGVFAHKAGYKKIKGTIIEQLIYTKKINEDSTELQIKEHKKFFEKDVFVKNR